MFVFMSHLSVTLQTVHYRSLYFQLKNTNMTESIALKAVAPDSTAVRGKAERKKISDKSEG